jgi:imidazolonepropionase-like amidohydrolase
LSYFPLHILVIKIMVGGGVASETDAIETVQYTAEEIQAITTTCKQMGGKMSRLRRFISLTPVTY